MKWCYFLIFGVVFIHSAVVCSMAPAQPISWADLAELNYETGEVPDSIQQLDKQSVEIAGFIVPLELDGYRDTVKEFILVPDPLACIHVPPPPPNQMVYVKMNKAIPLDMDFRGVSINGQLLISQSDLDYFSVSFELLGVSAQEANIEFDESEWEDVYDELDDILESL